MRRSALSNRYDVHDLLAAFLWYALNHWPGIGAPRRRRRISALTADDFDALLQALVFHLGEHFAQRRLQLGVVLEPFTEGRDVVEQRFGDRLALELPDYGAQLVVEVKR